MKYEFCIVPVALAYHSVTWPYSCTQVCRLRSVVATWGNFENCCYYCSSSS